VYGTASNLRCFDEASPCELEQYSFCVVDGNDQSKYVPWLVCMDSNGDPIAQCDSENNIDSSAMDACKADNSAQIDKYLAIDSPIGGTPTVYVNGASVRSSYSAISRALCKADSSLSGCSAAMPNGAEEEVPMSYPPSLEILA